MVAQTNETMYAQLERAIDQIWGVARRLGLDPFPTHFELVPSTIMYEFGAYGLPGRFSHWTHGKAYHQMKTMYDYGLSKIYELVINSNPCYAFLLDGNSLMQNKLVIAHVLAHSDFFRHNVYFADTHRHMVETASVNADRIRRYEFEHGTRELERLLDAILSIEEHIDITPRIGRSVEQPGGKRKLAAERTTPFDDLFELEQRGSEEEPRDESPPKQFPSEPEKDLLGFLMEHAPDLEDWQRDVVAIVRQESIYFQPQRQTKVLNEGWASLWHARIMRELDLPTDEYADFAQLHASVLATSRRAVNPYHVGLKLLEDVERRWENPSEQDRERLRLPGGQGTVKVFEMRELESDLSAIRTYLTRELVEDLDLYVYRLDGGEWKIIDKNWERVRDNLVRRLTNSGIPYIVVQDGDYKRNRELYLKHCFEGEELDLPYLEKTLRYIYQLWGRPVHLETLVEEKPTLFAFDGSQNSNTIL